MTRLALIRLPLGQAELTGWKIAFADILSVLGMTYSDENRLDSLKYRLLSPTTDPGSWGHEYVRHLALEIGLEQNKREEKEEGSDDLIELALSLVPFFLKHNAEADAVDILYELDLIEKLPQFLDENTYARVCLYMVSMVPLLSPPDDLVTLRTAHTIYRQFNKLPQALTMAIRLNDVDLIKEDLAATDDPVLKKQLAFLIGRQHIWLDMEDQEEDFRECVNNIHISEHFLALGKELNILDPKTPEDIYKSHLENTRGPSTTIDSAKQNLANSFVNAFVNAGFTSDKLMLADEDGNSSWVYKNKDEGMLSATASIGVLHRWNVDEGLGVIDRFMESTDANIKAGAALAIGLVNSGVHSETDAAMALLCDEAFLESDKPRIKCSAIMGLGLAYAGSQRQELKDFLIPILADSSNSVEIAATAAIALGNIFVGSSDGDISSNILQVLMEREEVQLKDKWAQFLALGLALLFVGRQEDAEAVLETLKVITDPIGKATSVLVTACAYAGTGNVIKFQSLLEECQDHIDVSEEDSGQDTFQAYAVLGLALIAMGEDIGSEMSLRQFGHLMHYGEPVVRKAVPLAMGLLNASNPQMKVYDTLSRYSHDNDLDVAVNAIFAMGLVGAGTNNARLAQLLRQLASYYHRDPNTLFMVRIAQGLLHMGKGTLSLSPFHTERSVMSRVSVAALLNVAVSLVDAKSCKFQNSPIVSELMLTQFSHPRQAPLSPLPPHPRHPSPFPHNPRRGAQGPPRQRPRWPGSRCCRSSWSAKDDYGLADAQYPRAVGVRRESGVGG